MYRETCETIKRERDDLRGQVDEYRAEQDRRIERDRAERDRQRAEMRRRANPSNRLYNGEVDSFTEATRLHVMACELERGCESMKPTPDDDEKERAVLASIQSNLNESIDKANRARAIYDQITAETNKRIAEALRADGLDDWAECLESGDYSPMAI